MEGIKVSATGMLWFRNAAQFAEFLAIFEDAAVLPKSYSQWHKRATELYENLLRQGHVVIKAQASPDEFRAWCDANGYLLNAEGRMAFSSSKAAEKIRQAHPVEKNQ